MYSSSEDNSTDSVGSHEGYTSHSMGQLFGMDQPPENENDDSSPLTEASLMASPPSTQDGEHRPDNAEKSEPGSPSEQPPHVDPSSSSHTNLAPRRQHFAKPLDIIVDSPQKVSEGPSAFITYLITAEFSSQPTTRVRRRFSDFVKLYTQLVDYFPGCAVPPLPDFSRLEYIAGDRFGAEFTSRRAASLQRFMFRLLCHPDLCSSRILTAFITPREAGLSDSFHGGSVGKPAITGEGGVIDIISDSLLNAFSKVKYQSREMLEAKERADRFEHNVTALDKSFMRVSRRQTDIIHDLSDFHKQQLMLANLEPQSLLEHETLAKTAKSLGMNFSQLHGDMEKYFGGALRDMTHYVQAIKTLLKQREQRQIDYEALVEYLQRTEASHAASLNGVVSSSFLRAKVNDIRGVNKEQARQARTSKLAERMEELRAEVGKAKHVSNAFEEVAKREMAVFESTESLELQASLKSIADGHIAYYRRVLAQCKEIEANYCSQSAQRAASSSTHSPHAKPQSLSKSVTPSDGLEML